MLEMRFALVQPADAVPLTVKGAIGEATLQKEIYGPLIEALSAKNYAPKTLRQLSKAVPDITFASLQQAISLLVGMGSTAPCQSETAEKQVQNRCTVLNSHLFERARFGNEIEVLASPVTGGGVVVGRFHQLFLMAIKQGKKQPSEWASHAWQIITDQGQRLIKNSKTLETPEENMAELTAQAIDFSEKNLTMLKALRIA